MTRVIQLAGTHFEQGVQEGRLMSGEIQENCAVVKAGLEASGYDKKKYADFLVQNASFMKEAQPDLYAEMEGIAQGSGIPWREILSLNIPAYFMKSCFVQECSMILVRGKATADGGTYIIKNRDMSIPVCQGLIRREYPGGLKVAEVSGIGTLTYPGAGINSYGLAAATTGSWPKSVIPDLSMADRAQIFFNIRLLLDQCKTAKEALNYIASSPRINGINLLVADPGEAYAVELTKDEMDVQRAGEDGILYRTNHYLSERFSPLNTTDYSSTYCRAARIKDFLEKRAGKIRFQDLFRIMSDHENGLNGICRHPEGGVKVKTVSTSLVSIEDNEVWTTLSNPCECLPSVSI